MRSFLPCVDSCNKAGDITQEAENKEPSHRLCACGYVYIFRSKIDWAFLDLQDHTNLPPQLSLLYPT